MRIHGTPERKSVPPLDHVQCIECFHLRYSVGHDGKPLGLDIEHEMAYPSGWNLHHGGAGQRWEWPSSQQRHSHYHQIISRRASKARHDPNVL